MSLLSAITDRKAEELSDLAFMGKIVGSGMSLTEEQKFWIAVAGGVPMSGEYLPDGKVRLTLTSPCDVIWDGDKFKIFTR